LLKKGPEEVFFLKKCPEGAFFKKKGPEGAFFLKKKRPRRGQVSFLFTIHVYIQFDFQVFFSGDAQFA